MIIPIKTDYRMSGRPWVNYLLVAANILFFVAGYNGASVRSQEFLLYPDMPQLYQFFTSIFMHGSWAHLLGNMIFLWVFGNALNDRLGHAGYLAFYLAGGVLAGVGYLVLSGHAPVLGASGAISAVTGAYLVLFPRVRVTLLVLLVIFFVPFEISSLYFLLFQFVFNLWMTLSPELTGASAGGVAYAAHGAGYVFGILVAILLLAGGLVPREPFDLLNLFRASRRRQSYRQMVQEGYAPFTGDKQWVDSRVVEQATPDTEQARVIALRKEIYQALTRGDASTAAALYRQLVAGAEEIVLGQQQQLDVANQLMSEEDYPSAAMAYEKFLQSYPLYEHIADIYLMLGLIYGRYLGEYRKAQQDLAKAVELLKDPRKVELARGDLEMVRRHLDN